MPTPSERRRAGARVRCYAELNDFLPAARRFVDITVEFDVPPSVKDLIEGIGVPHTEVDLVLASGQSVDFTYRVRDGDRISVYPRFESLDIGSIVRVRPEPLRVMRFVLDGHLGRLARYLRLAGFDARYAPDRADADLARTSVDQSRILLTRDRGLLKRSAVTHGYCVRATSPPEQLVEVVRRFDLGDRLAPFTRCLACNGELVTATRAEVGERVPFPVQARHDAYTRCPDCGRVYWPGSHHRRLSELLDDARRQLR